MKGKKRTSVSGFKKKQRIPEPRTQKKKKQGPARKEIAGRRRGQIAHRPEKTNRGGGDNEDVRKNYWFWRSQKNKEKKKKRVKRDLNKAATAEEIDKFRNGGEKEGKLRQTCRGKTRKKKGKKKNTQPKREHQEKGEPKMSACEKFSSPCHEQEKKKKKDAGRQPRGQSSAQKT